MDFLGLRNLSLMNNILELVHRTEPQFEIEKIDLNDPQTLQLFQRGILAEFFNSNLQGSVTFCVKYTPRTSDSLLRSTPSIGRDQWKILTGLLNERII